MAIAGTIEKGIAFVGAVIVLFTAGYQFRNELRTTWRLDNILTRVLLALLVLGCILVILAAVGVLGNGVA
ncbi:MAG: hypothetical protein ACREM6_02800 [Vulcanimicrobiaceae bacterium]